MTTADERQTIDAFIARKADIDTMLARLFSSTQARHARTRSSSR
jgi:hypothetical protein